MVASKSCITIDPRTKIILLLAVNIFVFTNHKPSGEIAVIFVLFIVLMLFGLYGAAIKTVGLFGLFLFGQYILLPMGPDFIANAFTILFIIFRKLLPCVALGILLVKTTPVRLLIHALSRWHLPQSFIVPLAITVRYFPTLAGNISPFRTPQNYAM